MADLAAGALVLVEATVGAEAYFIALARSVAGDHRLHAGAQCIAIIVSWAAALRHVVDYAAPCAFSASLATFAGIWKEIN